MELHIQIVRGYRDLYRDLYFKLRQLAICLSAIAFSEYTVQAFQRNLPSDWTECLCSKDLSQKTDRDLTQNYEGFIKN